MRTSGFVAIALLATLASGQSDQQLSERVFNFVYARTGQAAGEIATAIRIVADVKQPEYDGKAPSTLTVRGTDEQIGLAQWIFDHLDQSNDAPHDAGAEYRLSSTDENVVRIFYIAHAANVSDLGELATAILNMVETRRLAHNTALKAIVARGTEDQMALTEWLVEHMDQPGSPPLQHSATPSYTTAEARADNTVQIFFAAHTSTIEEFQQMATAIRVVTQVRRMFTYRSPRAVAIRGTPNQMALAQWLFDALDRLPQSQRSSIEQQFSIRQRGLGNIVRVFYFTNATTADDLQNLGLQVREGLEKLAMQARSNAAVELGICEISRVVVLRGTAGQVASAVGIINETTPGF